MEVATRTRSDDLVNFEGTIFFGLTPPWGTPPSLRRKFSFEVKNLRRGGQCAIFKDGETVILEVDDELLDAMCDVEFYRVVERTVSGWEQFTIQQKVVLVYLFLGLRQAILSQWHLVSDHASWIDPEGVTKEEFHAVQFPEFVQK